MVQLAFPRGLRRKSPSFIILLTVALVATTFWWQTQHILHPAWLLLTLPLRWGTRGPYALSHPPFFIQNGPDSKDFDLTFAKYNTTQLDAGDGHSNSIPAILHHIILGNQTLGTVRKDWQDARQTCVDLHPGWQVHTWTDEKARALVDTKFPALKETWDSYPYLIERVDALRYMVLHEYGGAILDMDLECKRSLGPLRRFSFVAPAAHPTGFSISFMMASPHNDFITAILQRLPTYNHRWFLLPYGTVMFSTGGHFASTIHSTLKNRSPYKILAGPDDDPMLHSLNKHASTPLFHHLGSSSWHAYDGKIFVMLGRVKAWLVLCLIMGVLASLKLVIRSRTASRQERKLQAYLSKEALV